MECPFEDVADDLSKQIDKEILELCVLLAKIKTKNDALLNIHHPNEIVRKHCDDIIHNRKSEFGFIRK